MPEWEAMGTKLRQSHTELAAQVRQLYSPFQTWFVSIWTSSTSNSTSTDKQTSPVHESKISQYQLVLAKKSWQLCCLLAVVHEFQCMVWISHMTCSTDTYFSHDLQYKIWVLLTYSTFPIDSCTLLWCRCMIKQSNGKFQGKDNIMFGNSTIVSMPIAQSLRLFPSSFTCEEK